MAQHNCPKCSHPITIDLGTLEAFNLRFQCPSCKKRLQLTDRNKSLLDYERESSERNLEDMVRIALADGSLSEAENSLLRARVQEMGLEESVLDSFVSKAKEALEPTAALIEEYDEELASYRGQTGSYNWQGFAAKIALLPADHPHLKQYRDDLVSMISTNADLMKDLARQWERIYDRSSDSADWDEILENKSSCLETAAALRRLRDELLGQTKTEFVAYIQGLVAPDDSGW